MPRTYDKSPRPIQGSQHSHSRQQTCAPVHRSGCGACTQLNGVFWADTIGSECVIEIFRVTPFLQNGFRQNDPEFACTSQTLPSFKTSLSMPLRSSASPFSLCIDSFHFHPSTASILDYVRFLISNLLNMPVKHSPRELHKLKSAAAWMGNRISGLPEFSPNENLLDRTAVTISNGTSTLADSYVQPLYAPPCPDLLYAAARRTALMYTQAVAKRQSFLSARQSRPLLL